MRKSSIIRLIIWFLIVIFIFTFLIVVVFHKMAPNTNALVETVYLWGKDQFADAYRIQRYSSYRRRFTFFACVCTAFVVFMDFVLLKAPKAKKLTDKDIEKSGAYTGKVKLVVFEDSKEENN